MNKNHLYYILEYTYNNKNIKLEIPSNETNLNYTNTYTDDETMILFNAAFSNKIDLINNLISAINCNKEESIIPKDLDKRKINIYVGYKKNHKTIKMPVIFGDSFQDSKKAGIFSKNQKPNEFCFNYYEGFKTLLNKLLKKQENEKLETYRQELIQEINQILQVQICKLDEKCNKCYDKYKEKIAATMYESSYYKSKRGFIENDEKNGKSCEYKIRKLKKKVKNLSEELEKLNSKSNNEKINIEKKLQYIIENDLFIKPKNKNLIGLNSNENSPLFLYIISKVYDSIKNYNTDVALKQDRQDNLCNEKLETDQYSFEELYKAKENLILIEKEAKILADMRKMNKEENLQKETNLFNERYGINISVDEYETYLEHLKENNNLARKKEKKEKIHMKEREK